MRLETELRLERAIAAFTAGLRQEFAGAIDEDANSFRELAIRLVKRNLPMPRMGRPPDENITRAINLRSQGKTWPEVYASCIPGFQHLDSAWRVVTESRLRSAIRSRRKHRKAGSSSARPKLRI